MRKFMSNLKELKRVIPYKWRVQSFSKNYPTASCVAYIDARDVMELLDEAVGPDNWQSDYKEIKGNLYCGVGIKMADQWVWKWDCGTESNAEPEKGEASDAFKRAAVKWGIGRFLYDLPIQYVKTNEKKNNTNFPYPIDEFGNKIKNLTLFLNENNKIASFSDRTNSRNEKKIKKIIEKIDNCSTLDELRIIREENSMLEINNPAYKKALSKRYEILAGINKTETTSMS
jgi:hypothetical protein